jgi:glycosyltransferase involved in cell wall biosynthesis
MIKNNRVKEIVTHPTNGSKNTLRKRIALIPAYNEARFIGSVVLQTHCYVDQVVVVDDGSTDKTAEVAKAAGAFVLSMDQDQNMGKAKALSKGFEHIKKLKPTAVVMIDGDGQHNPSQIPNLLAPIEADEADMVIGSRFVGIESEIPKWRIVGQHALTVATNLASGVHSTDSQSGFRAFATHVLPLLDFRAKGFSVESEMQFIAREHKLRVAEVPISVVYEEPSKRNPVAHALQVLNGVLRLVGQSRPLLFFGMPGLTFLLSGLGIGVWVVSIFQKRKELATGYALICVLCSIIGGIGLATGLILHSIRSLLGEWLRPISKLQKKEVFPA